MTPPLRHGEPWGRAARGPADAEVIGDDRDLAELAATRPGTLVRFRPSPASDLARAVGLGPGSATETRAATEVLVDALRLDDGRLAMNAVVVGQPPDRLRWRTRARDLTVTIDGREWFAGRATTVLVANGQHLRGRDLVPRGHPGDGWAEVQVYALRRSERAEMRRRLVTGTHVPHPRIRQVRARRIEVTLAGSATGVEVDAVAAGSIFRLTVSVVPGAIRLLL
jgi:hypothetical protein